MRIKHEVSLKLNSPAWLGQDQLMAKHVILFLLELETYGVIQISQNCICWCFQALLEELTPSHNISPSSSLLPQTTNQAECHVWDDGDDILVANLKRRLYDSKQ